MDILELSTTLVVEPSALAELATQYTRWFGARRTVDTGWYVVLELGQGSLALMAPRQPGQTPLQPGSLNINLRVPSVDQTYALLREHGAPLAEPPSDKPYGLRSFAFRDGAGVCWYVFQPLPPPSESIS